MKWIGAHSKFLFPYFIDITVKCQAVKLSFTMVSHDLAP